MKVFFLITIDTECDKGPGWIIQQPMRFESVINGIPDILTPLFGSFNLRPTYLLSPEVIADDECVQSLKNCRNAELGTHLHGEFIEPEAEWEAKRTKTPQIAYNRDLEAAKLENLTLLFEKKMGYRPTSFRAGRWGMSFYTLDILESLKYTVDSSVCPFRTHKFDNNLSVNYWGAPLQPYHPSKHNILKAGNHKIIEVPATLGNPHLIYWPRFILRQFSDQSHVKKRILKKLGLSTSIKWLRPYKSSAEEMTLIADSYINRFGSNKKPVFLNMMFHSNEIIPAASPYPQTEGELENFIKSLYQLFENLSSRYELEGIGLSDVAKII